MAIAPAPFYIPTKHVMIAPGHPGFDVGGATLQDVSFLLQTHGAAMAVLYSRYVEKNSTLANATIDSAVAELVSDMPVLIADLISRTSGGALTREIALRLPLTVQVDTLIAISELTFVGENALEKFLLATEKMMSGLSRAVQQATAKTA